MPAVRVEPAGIVVAADEGQTVMSAAEAAGYRWPTVCGGMGTCRTCFVRVTAGAECLSPVDRFEQAGIDALGVAGDRAEPVRLACQARPVGDVTVWKPGVHPR